MPCDGNESLACADGVVTLVRGLDVGDGYTAENDFEALAPMGSLCLSERLWWPAGRSQNPLGGRLGGRGSDEKKRKMATHDHDAGVSRTRRVRSVIKASVLEAPRATAPRRWWSEAVALLTAVLTQLEDDGHDRVKLRAVLMSLGQKGWRKNK